MSDTTYEVVYFGIPGRAEPIRMLLAYVGVPFTDTRLDPAGWMARKADTGLGQLPVLIERRGGEARTIPQSQAILRHLARRFGLYGSTADEALAADIVAETCADLRADLAALIFGPAANDPTARVKFFQEKLPVHLGRLETLHGAGPGAFFVGSAPTFADLVAYDTLDKAQQMFPDALAGRTALQGFLAVTRAVPAFGAYLAKRG